MVTALYEPDDVLDKAYELARELIIKTAPVSTAVIRQAVLRMSAMDSPEATFELDSKLIGGIGESSDAIEGVMSFLERPRRVHRTCEQGPT